MNHRKLKVLVLSLGLALGTMVPTVAHAQYGGGLFSYGHEEEQLDREGVFRSGNQGGFNIGTQHFGDDVYGGFNISTQLFGQEAPLGGGWLVLTIAGVAYAFRRRKDNNK